MKNVIYLLIVLVSLLNWGCACDSCLPVDNSLDFEFKIDSTASGFMEEEVDTIRLYKLTKNTNHIEDSAIISGGKPFILNEFGFDFGGKEGPYWENDYHVITQSTKEFMITDIEIGTEKQGRGTCKCEVNILKKLKVNGISFDLSRNALGDDYVRLSK